MATSGNKWRIRTHPSPPHSALPSIHMEPARSRGSQKESDAELLPPAPLLSKRHLLFKQQAGVLARVTFGFALQLLSTFSSISVFVDEGETCYLWTGMAVSMGLMLRTPSERYLERYTHVISGVLAYLVLDYHYERFPTTLIMCTALSNALGQILGDHGMRRVFPSTPLSNRDVQRLEFLSALMTFPVLLGSVAASVPGSLGFHHFIGANLWEVFVNYTIGHISGTAVVLYPALVLAALWGHTQQPLGPRFVLPALAGCVGVGFLFAFAEYGVFAFAAIIGTFCIIVSVCSLLDQWSACLMEATASALILGLTAGGRGPFHSIYMYDAQRDVLLSTQLATTAGVVCGAFVCLSSTRFRLLEASEKIALNKTEEMIETQTVQLCRVGHDMLNNTTVVLSMSESLAASLPATGDSSREQLKSIQAAITMNGTLVKDMVDSFRPRHRSGTIRQTEVDLREMMALHVNFANALARMGDKRIIASLEMEGTIKLLTDRDRLHQVLNNLVGNAVKYTLSGSITLRAARRRCEKGATATASDSVILQVMDTGIGIDSEDIPNVFDTLFRCARGTKFASGTGLGLSSVLESCRLLGAEVTAESPGVNQGSTFTLEFPGGACVASTPSTTVNTDVETPFTLPAGGMRALVVDDSKVIRSMMKRYLLQLGCDVVALESGEKAKEHLLEIEATAAFDVVIADNNMGDGCCSGVDLVSDIRSGRLRGVRMDMPCILCSGLEVAKRERDDNTFFMWKPFSQVEVSHALHAVAERMADADNAGGDAGAGANAG